MSDLYSNHYPGMPVYKHKDLPIVETGEFDFYRCVQFQNSFYGKTVSELHGGNLRKTSGRYSNLFPGEKISYWASDSKTARAEVKKHGANNNLLTFFAYDDATATFPTLSKNREFLRIVDGVNFGFSEILLKIENGQNLTKGETDIIQRIKEEKPDCLAYESVIDRTKTNYIFFEKGFRKLAIRELRLRLGSEEKISQNRIYCAGGSDYSAYLKNYGKFFVPKTKIDENVDYVNSAEYNNRLMIKKFWHQMWDREVSKHPHLTLVIDTDTNEIKVQEENGIDE